MKVCLSKNKSAGATQRYSSLVEIGNGVGCKQEIKLEMGGLGSVPCSPLPLMGVALHLEDSVPTAETHKPPLLILALAT